MLANRELLRDLRGGFVRHHQIGDIALTARIANRGDGVYQWQSAAGNLYADEYWASHWDILYY